MAINYYYFEEQSLGKGKYGEIESSSNLFKMLDEFTESVKKFPHNSYRIRNRKEVVVNYNSNKSGANN